MYDAEYKNRCIHHETDEEHRAEDFYGAVSFPIFQTATFTHPGVAKVLALITAGHRILHDKDLSRWQHSWKGHRCICTYNGNGGSIRLFRHVNAKNQISFTSVDVSVCEIEKEILPQTKAVFIETPTNPMMHVTDIEKLAKINKEHGILLIVDNTFLSPYFQNPLNLGADVVKMTAD